jgi:hypothetical protein
MSFSPASVFLPSRSEWASQLECACRLRQRVCRCSGLRGFVSESVVNRPGRTTDVALVQAIVTFDRLP